MKKKKTTWANRMNDPEYVKTLEKARLNLAIEDLTAERDALRARCEELERALRFALGWAKRNAQPRANQSALDFLAILGEIQFGPKPTQERFNEVAKRFNDAQRALHATPPATEAKRCACGRVRWPFTETCDYCAPPATEEKGADE